VPAEHDSEFSARNRILALCGARVEDDAKGAFGVLLKGDGLWDQVAKALVGVEVGS
jgi:hypothetical protein